MKILLSFLLLVMSIGAFNKADAFTKTVSGSINCTNNGQPCVLSYNLTITGSIGLGGIQITSVTGTLTGCGVNISISGCVVYNGGGANGGSGWNNNGQNTITAFTFQQVSDPNQLPYLNSQEVQQPLCNEFNNVIVPELGQN